MRRHVYYYTHVDVPYEVAASLLAGEPSAWLPPPARPDRRGWEVTLRAEGALPESLGRWPASLELDEGTRNGRRLLRGLRWRSGAAPQLFPVLEADLALEELSGSGCHLSLMGSYRPPLSVVGAAGDRLLGQRVAEACARRFVLDVADRLHARAALEGR